VNKQSNNRMHDEVARKAIDGDETVGTGCCNGCLVGVEVGTPAA
jgi:hypothetical protein